MRIVTWNIEKRRQPEKLRPVLEGIAELSPDLVTLQEVVSGAVPPLLESLGGQGLTHSLPSLRNGKGNLIASRWPLAPAPAGWSGPLPFPELMTRATVDLGTEAIDLIAVHMPNGSGNGVKKLAHFHALSTAIAVASPTPRLISGDFNSPRDEAVDGKVRCFGGDYRNRGCEWEDAEQAVITGLSAHGLRDVFRAAHGYERRAYSHINGRVRRRFDHLFASEHFATQAVDYRIDWLEPPRRSDHAPLWADLALRTA
jgi:exonuclease III